MSDKGIRLIDRVLTFMDKPWKAVAVVVILILLGLGYFLWIERLRLAEWVFENSAKPELLMDVFNDDAERLLRMTRSDLVVFGRVSLDTNTVEDLSGWDREGKRVVPVEGPRPIFYVGQSMGNIVKLLSNEVVCRPVPGIDNPGAEWEAEARMGITRACLVAVPPAFTATAGVLVVGWHEALRHEQEQQVSQIIHRAAARYARW